MTVGSVTGGSASLVHPVHEMIQTKTSNRIIGCMRVGLGGFLSRVSMYVRVGQDIKKEVDFKCPRNVSLANLRLSNMVQLNVSLNGTVMRVTKKCDEQTSQNGALFFNHFPLRHAHPSRSLLELNKVVNRTNINPAVGWNK